MSGFLVSDEEDNEYLTFEVVEVVGYDTYHFKYHPSKFDDLENAEDVLQHALSEELQLFYELTRRSNRRWRESARLSKAADELSSRHTRGGLSNWFYRVFRSGLSARRLALEALQARLVSAEDAEYAREYIQSALSSTYALHAFTDSLRESAHESNSIAIDTAMEVARLVEGTRSAEYEVVIVAGATLLGGLIALAGAGIAGG